MKLSKLTRILAFALLVIFSSCTKTDPLEVALSQNETQATIENVPGNNTIPDLNQSIIGNWKPVKRVRVCATGTEEVIDFSTCHQIQDCHWIRTLL